MLVARLARSIWSTLGKVFSGMRRQGLYHDLGLGTVAGPVVLGVVTLGAVQTPRTDFGRDFYMALAVPVLFFILALEGRVLRGEAFLLLAIFLPWLALTVNSALRQRDTAVANEARVCSPGKRLILGVLDLGSLFAAGRLSRPRFHHEHT